MLKIVFLLEEQSMKETLDILLPNIIPQEISYICIPHQGKGDLQNSIPLKLISWREPNVKFIVVHDQDTSNCYQLKDKLTELTKSGGRPDTIIRIICSELETWFLGDFQAIEKAFNVDLKNIKNKAKYRIPDEVINAKEELKKIVPMYQQISGSRSIAKYMDVHKKQISLFSCIY